MLSQNPIQKAIHNLDKWLWLKGLGHPIILPLVRNEIIASLLAIGLGIIIFLYSSWVFWFGIGLFIMALTFFSLTHFFMHTSIESYNQRLLFKVLLLWVGRLLITCCMLFVALVLCAAQISALIAGLVCASILALVSYAVYSSRH